MKRLPPSSALSQRPFGLPLALALTLLGPLALALAACGSGAGGKAGIHVLTADGVVDPVMANYVDRGLDEAEEAEASFVVLRLDTPGGLDSAMRDIIQRIYASAVPVVVYVWPQGARAASAGTFITMAGHVAAMAPNTSIGAAHPVAAGGEEIEGPLNDKVTNDAASYIRGIAELRGRNADWAEQAVRESVSVNQREALELGVIDLVAVDMNDLLAQLEGRTVALNSGQPLTLRAVGVPLVENDMTLAEQFLALIADPNIAFILLSLGMLGIFFELLNPGTFVPGIFGVIAVTLAFFALGNLPVNWAGVILIFVAFTLFAAEVFVTSGGALAVGGVIALVFGGLLLFGGRAPSSLEGSFRVSLWAIVGLAAAMGAAFLFIITQVVRARRLPVATGAGVLVGRTAVVRSPLDPQGYVSLMGEQWRATAEDGPVAPGERVTVVGVEGLRLRVRRREEPLGEELRKENGS